MYVRRKVYSMQQPEEQLYSVMMSEEELALFSDFCEELEALYSEDSDKVANAAEAAGAATLAGGLGYAGYKEGGKIKNAGAQAVREARHALAKNKVTGKVVKESGLQRLNKKITKSSAKQAEGIVKDLMKTKAGKAAIAAAATGAAVTGGAAGYKKLKKD